MLVSLVTLAIILSVIIVPGLLLQTTDEHAEAQEG
jgi:hypothetical protein